MTFDTNPLRKGLQKEITVDPCVFVIFGGTGDLAHRKLLPAIYHLYLEKLLPRSFAIISYAGSDMTDESYRDWVKDALAQAKPKVPVEGKLWDGFRNLLRYTRRDSQNAKASLADLKKKIEETDAAIGAGGNYLFYFAIPPAAFADTARALQKTGLAQENGDGWRRLVIEKPFGVDLKSAEELNNTLLDIFREDQLYRIDHYLGKETVQNILVFRFANQFIEPILNSRYVDHIQITMAESIGIEHRGAFYDSTGAARDVVQNHVLQMLSLICMEPPASLDPESVRDEKSKVLKSVRVIDSGEVNDYTVRAQYCGGYLMGKDVPGYRDEPKVSPMSKTETFVAIKLFVDNWRWDGVPVYLRTGKRLAKRVTEIAVQLKDVPGGLFSNQQDIGIQPNVIALQIQPDEGISMRFEAKIPGLTSRIQPVRMDFKYGTAFGASAPDAYERLILEAMLGDPSLFSRADNVEVAWAIVDPVIRGWEEVNSPVYCYNAGTWGPAEADDLIERDGRKWRRL